jgi:DNA-binding transcriptional regulator WhiA
MSGLRNAKKHCCNESLFSGSISTEKEAYVLGLLYSDGWISTAKHKSYTFGIQSTDLEIPAQVKAILEATHPVVVKKSYSTAHKTAYELRIDSKTLVNSLKRHGVVERKSHCLNAPDSVNQEQLKHFIRGLWDGDGSVKVRRGKYPTLSLVGSFDLIVWVCEFLKRELSIFGSLEHHGSVFRLTYHKEAKLLHSYLYDCSNYFLPRKKHAI